MNQSEKFWNKTAKKYGQEENKDQETFHKIMDISKKYLKPSDVLLDFGCGTGQHACILSQYVNQIKAIDISKNMIDIAKNEARHRHIENIDFAVLSIMSDTLKRQTYDVIISFYVLHLINDSKELLTRINHLLKPGGIFINVTPCMKEKKLLNIMLKIASKIGLVPKINAFRHDELIKNISDCDFEIVDIIKLTKKSPEYLIVSRKTQKM